jgi:nucleoside 2-deoxyribosyltransferase
MRAYIAGPLFNESERWWDEQIEHCAREAGLTTFLPHRDGIEGKQKRPDRLEAIFIEDRDAIDSSDVVIANLNGAALDDGTCWEIGYAYARGKHLIGVYTDWRTHFSDQVVNIMIQCSLNHLCRSLDELRDCLRQYTGNSG